MALQIYNTQTKKKEDFQTVEPGKVKMYVCGPTVYDFLHIGNYRGAIFYNFVRNWLEKRGYEVTYVYNYTDVDDKIINRANEEGVTSQEISEKYIKEFEKDYELLQLRPHTHNPKVSDNMDNIINFVKGLVEKEKAYVVDGDVYFDVKAFPDYGMLSCKNVDDMQSGHRIDVDTRKKNPADFALWKSAKEGEVSWDSPWGEGRPGWHIECSAMSRSILGDSLDIHGGGLDLVFPHHENEIAQSEGLTGKKYVRYWMHNNMLEFGNQKMSKSLGNVRTGRSFLEQFDGEILKYMMLQAHYRSTIDFSDAQVALAVKGLARIYSSLAHAQSLIAAEGLALVPVPEKFQSVLSDADTGIEEAFDDDFNTAEALGKIFEVVRAYNNIARKPGKVKPDQKAVAEVFFHWLRNQGSIMAMFQQDPAGYLESLDMRLLAEKGIKPEDVESLLIERAKAREAKDYQKSDEIRDKLMDMGISIQDSATGTAWEVTK
ncbi:MAG: cysteine--tRNA ligase [Bdellovibrionales bacterium]|nr:cysteine--tRNA ligase [Bdellovibrionales bacterium]